MSDIQTLVKDTIKEHCARFPQIMGKDTQAIMAGIHSWIEELLKANVSAEDFLEIKETLAKDARFVSKPPKIEDFLAIKKQNKVLEEIGTDDSSRKLIAACKVMSKKFGEIYGFRWIKPSLEDANDRLETWIKHLALFNISAESLDPACIWISKQSDYNRFPPTLNDFTLACRMAMCGETLPSPQEAYLMACGLSKKELHPLVVWAQNEIGAYELRTSKAALRETFIAVYQNAIMEYAITRVLPDMPSKSAQENKSIDTSGIISRSAMMDIISDIQLKTKGAA